jgi:hypothetical protein
MTAPEVNRNVQEKPYNVHEMPVENRCLKTKIVLHGEMVAQKPAQANR